MRMKWLRVCGFFLPLVLGVTFLYSPSVAQAAGAAFVQAIGNAVGGSVSTYSVSFPGNTTAGDVILVGFDYTGGLTVTSVTDTQGNTFLPVGGQLTSPGGSSSSLYYAKNIRGGADTVTVTVSAATGGIELYLAEYTGIDTVNPIDAQAGAVGFAGTVSSGNATTTVAGDIIFGYCLADWSCTVGTGFAARSTLNHNLIEDMVAGSAGSYAATGTANNGWTMHMAALKPAGGSGVMAPAITSPLTATGTVGTAFSYQITATNNPTSYGATGLPSMLTVNTATGAITGTPTATGSYTVTLSATNAGGTGTATLNLSVNNPAAPVINSPLTATGTVNTAFSYQITATNSPTSYGAMNLPDGLMVSASTGLISGTPTAVGMSMVAISATNAGGTGSATLTLTVNNPASPIITSSPTANGTVNISFSYQITATNNPTSFGATGLPSGLTVNTMTGLISGTPTATGTSMASISATNSGGTGTATLTITVTTATLTAIVVSPQNAVIQDSGGTPSSQAYTATGYYDNGSIQDVTGSVVWASTNAAVATVSTSGLATSGSLSGGQSAGFTGITATSGSVHGVSILSVTNHIGNGFPGVFTQHNDIGRTGQDVHETVLTPALVNNTATFGKKFSQPVDGYVYGQPLYVPNITIPGLGTHNVIYVVTEADSVYAFDADSNTGPNANPLWKVSLINTDHGATPMESTVDSANDIGCTDVLPQIGITSTPVIDPSTNSMYVVAKSKLSNGSFVQRLHVLDITTGSEKAPGPVVITGTVPGTAIGGNGTSVTFDPRLQLNRTGLLLVNGVLYLAFGSHCDYFPYFGWLFAYDSATLVQKGVFNTTPNASYGGIWMGGTGLAADSQGNIYASTGNGNFDTTSPVLDFGDSVFRSNLATGSLFPLDYFTPYDQQMLNNNDGDLASGGILLLPDQPGAHPHELISVGKEGTIYLVDRDQMTVGNQHYCANCNSDPQIVQELPGIINGVFGVSAYWNNTAYFWGIFDYLRAFPLTNGQLAASPSSTASVRLTFPGATPSISSNGTTNGIVWAIDSTAFGPPHTTPAGPAVLHAFDATNVARELYNSTMAANGRDSAGNAVKFSLPTVANGKVYIGTASELDVYGPLP